MRTDQKDESSVPNGVTGALMTVHALNKYINKQELSETEDRRPPLPPADR